jgi:hypothetical protein
MPDFFLIILEVGCGQSPKKKLQVTNICKGTARKTWLICNEVISTLENLLFTKQEGGSSHFQMGGGVYAQAVIFDWLEHALCGKPVDTHIDPQITKQITNIRLTT